MTAAIRALGGLAQAAPPVVGGAFEDRADPAGITPAQDMYGRNSVPFLGGQSFAWDQTSGAGDTHWQISEALDGFTSVLSGTSNLITPPISVESIFVEASIHNSNTAGAGPAVLMNPTDADSRLVYIYSNGIDRFRVRAVDGGNQNIFEVVHGQSPPYILRLEATLIAVANYTLSGRLLRLSDRVELFSDTGTYDFVTPLTGNDRAGVRKGSTPINVYQNFRAGELP